jgi:LuxR family transcriptional regulator, maltose regulon positive regulatory protein
MMILDFSSQEFNEWQGAIGASSNSGGGGVSAGGASVSEKKASAKSIERVRLIADKICVPAIRQSVERPRLIEHLEKCLQQTGATLVKGRAGTGKTALAAEFARQTTRAAVAWYNIEAADADWQVFAKYLAGCFYELCPGSKAALQEIVGDAPGKEQIAQITEAIAGCLAESAREKPLLIVLDDVHHVFDADWFEEFFQSFIFSLTEDMHLLMLSRSEPPLPIWRMRSKQFLSVVDEDLLTFTTGEAVELFRSCGVSAKAALVAHQESYGRVGKLAQIADAFANKTFDKM